MYKKKIYLFLIIVILLNTTGCLRQIYNDPQNMKSLNYSFIIYNSNNMDKILSKQKYGYPLKTNNQYIAIITYKNIIGSLKQYVVGNDKTLNLTIPKDSEFIISLHANRTIMYTWNIKNNINNGIIQFKKRSWIAIPTPISEWGKKGENYDRQNFYFKPLKSGNEKMIMRYEHQTQSGKRYEEITFNIQIK